MQQIYVFPTNLVTDKVERIESSVRDKNFSKSIFEDIFILKECQGFLPKYANTISHIRILRNEDLGEKYLTLLKRFHASSLAAVKLRPDLWEAVQREMNEKFSKNRYLGIKLATWEIVGFSPGTKIY